MIINIGRLAHLTKVTKVLKKYIKTTHNLSLISYFIFHNSFSLSFILTESLNMTVEDSSSIIAIEELQNHGINQSDIQRLRDAGICSVATLVATTSRNVTKIKGFSEVKCQKVKAAAKNIIEVGFVSGSDQSTVRERVCYISTGCKAFDDMLGGGIATMSISEVFGEFRCGKTQLSHTLCVMAQLSKELGGAEGKVAYIDTEGTFRPDRIAQICQRFEGIDPNEVLDNISYARSLNSEHQMELIEKIASELATGTYKLLIIDSIMAQFRVDYCGRGELGERQQKLNQMLGRLCRLAEDFNIAVFMTNQVQSDPGAAASLFASIDGRKPIGGHVLAHASSTRILLRKGKGNERVAKLQDSPDMPEAECTYLIGENGICDVA